LKVKEFLLEHQRPRVRWPFAIIAVIALIGAFPLVLRNMGQQQHPWAALTWAALIWILLVAGAAVLAFKIDNHISLEKKADSQSFWARNREAFATHAVTATISAAIGGFVGWILGHFFK
jgi:uncharacterized membrane protein YbjE (DUF340 family)